VFGALLLISLSLSGCGSQRGVAALPPGVTAHVREENYEVRGTTVEEIGRSLTESSNAALGGNIVGLHHWNLGWNYTYGIGRMGCEIRQVVMELTSTVTVPIWVDRDRADPDVAAIWDEYLEALEAHEFRHRRLSYLAAREISVELNRLRVETCTMMSQHAGETGERILAKYRALNEEVDQERISWPPRAGGIDRDR
jgi:predicted secreted Zn-dependent protease